MTQVDAWRRLLFVVAVVTLALVVYQATQEPRNYRNVVQKFPTTMDNISMAKEIAKPEMKVDNFFERNMAKQKPSDVLLSYGNTAPDTVHVLTCGWNEFQFVNFLSLLSIMKVHQPNRLMLHYWADNAVHRRKNDYNQWFDLLEEEYHNIIPSILGKTSPNCTNDDVMTDHLKIILRSGGIYVKGTVILTESLQPFRKRFLSVGVLNGNKTVAYSNIAYLVARKGKIAGSSSWNFEQEQHSCMSEAALRNMSEIPSDTKCVQLSKKIIPASIVGTSDALSKLIRQIYYGSAEPRFPKWSMDNPIANIGHLLLLEGRQMNMLTYLGIKSMIHCVGADAVYIYIDTPPTGEWFEKLRKSEPRAIFVRHEHPQYIFGHTVQSSSHISDFIRFDALYKHGGIYFDWDAIVLRPLGDLRGYDFVTSVFMPAHNGAFPKKFNTGVLAAKKGAQILRKSLRAFQKYNRGRHDFSYWGLLSPYKLYEQYPEMVKIDHSFHIICFEKLCNLIHYPEVVKVGEDPIFTTKFLWKNVTALHWTQPVPGELLSMKKLLETKSLFADVGRYVLSCKREKTIKNYGL